MAGIDLYGSIRGLAQFHRGAKSDRLIVNFRALRIL